MPHQFKFFMDPKFVIDKYSRCRLNAKHTKVESWSCLEVYYRSQPERCSRQHGRRCCTAGCDIP
jgi:hypothetical protein